RSPDNAPRRVEPIAVLETALEFAFRAEDVDEAEAIAADGIMAGAILFGIRDENAAADVLDVKGREIVGNAVVIERVFAQMYAVEIGVVDFDAGGTEIGDIEDFFAVDFAGGHALVDGAVPRALIGVVHFENGIDRGRFGTSCNVGAGIPSGNRSVLGGKDEEGGQTGGRTLVQEKIGGAAVEDNAGGRRLGSRGKTRRRNHYKVIERTVDPVTVRVWMRICREVSHRGCGGSVS